MEHILPPLPYSKSALEPHISAETFDYHYDKHHAAYITKLNTLIKGTKFEYMPLEEIILSSEGAVFNNAAQAWNHGFFWQCLSPQGGGEPGEKLKKMIEKKWGDLTAFKSEFEQSAVNNFGSGWTWLVQNKAGELEILNTSNADTPKTSGLKALLTLDVWEHAYYIDYRNSRPDFVKAFWNVINWDFAEKNLT